VRQLQVPIAQGSVGSLRCTWHRLARSADGDSNSKTGEAARKDGGGGVRDS